MALLIWVYGAPHSGANLHTAWIIGPTLQPQSYAIQSSTWYILLTRKNAWQMYIAIWFQPSYSCCLHHPKLSRMMAHRKTLQSWASQNVWDHLLYELPKSYCRHLPCSRAKVQDPLHTCRNFETLKSSDSLTLKRVH